MLRHWIHGFQKNRQGHYIAEDEVREVIFTRTPRTSSPTKAQPAEPEEIELEEDLVNLDDEPDLSQEEEEVLLCPSPVKPPPAETIPKRETDTPEWLHQMRADKGIPDWVLTVAERYGQRSDQTDNESLRGCSSRASRNESSLLDESYRPLSVGDQDSALTNAVN